MSSLDRATRSASARSTASSKRVLQQQIVDRVGGKRQLRKHRQCHRLLVALLRRRQDGRGVGRRVRQGRGRRAGRNAHEAPVVQ